MTSMMNMLSDEMDYSCRECEDRQVILDAVRRTHVDDIANVLELASNRVVRDMEILVAAATRNTEVMRSNFFPSEYIDQVRRVLPPDAPRHRRGGGNPRVIHPRNQINQIVRMNGRQRNPQLLTDLPPNLFDDDVAGDICSQLLSTRSTRRNR